MKYIYIYRDVNANEIVGTLAADQMFEADTGINPVKNRNIACELKKVSL